jgi:Bacterial surface proteins containing Ig-like domains
MRNSSAPLRPVTVSVTGGPMDPAAYMGVYHKVLELEDRYEKSLNAAGVSSGLTDISAKPSVITVNHPFRIYVFNLTTVFATGTYTFAFVESAPNTESVIPVQSIDVTPATATIAVAGTRQLAVAFTPSNASSNAVTYVSSDVTKATVSASGLVTGVASGSATITITSSNGKTDTVAITVS